MSGESNTGPLTKVAGAAIPAYSIVMQEAGGTVIVATATATNEPIGVTGEGTAADGDTISVTPLNTAGVIQMRAAGALAINVPVFLAAAGEIDDLPASGATDHRRVGVTMEAAAAANDVISVLPQAGGVVITAPA